MQDKNHYNNNFDFLRFCAAALVIFSHAYPLTGRPEFFAVRTGHVTGGALGVAVFFIISGYLITASYLHSASLRDYLRKRVLRIFPGLIASVLVCALIIGPAVTTLPLSEYVRDARFFGFLRNMTLYFLQGAFVLPGVFETHPNIGINGVYWTLPIEFTMYLSLIVLGWKQRISRWWLLVITAAFYLVHYQMTPQTSGFLLRMSWYYLTIFGALFYAGALLYLHRDKVLTHRWRHALFAALAILALLCLKTPAGNAVLYLTMPYLVIYLAHARLPMISRWGKHGDFSYGLYLYGFPVQQLVIRALGTEPPIITHVCFTFAGALACAYLSWHLVEAPMLRLKRRLSPTAVPPAGEEASS